MSDESNNSSKECKRVRSASQSRPVSSTDADCSAVVIGGGTGANSFVAAFSGTSRTTYVLPVSDDGGSSAEIQRVLNGGPSLGDVRSRLVRLIPDASLSSPLTAIRRLLEHRLSATDPTAAKEEWLKVVEGKHPLWAGIPNDRKECMRAFLIHVNGAILKRAQRSFSFLKASIGNLLLAGAFLYLGGLPPAIFLFASITDIPHERYRVVPVINTSSTATIAAELDNGEIIAGQSEISHPSPANSWDVGSTTPISPQTRLGIPPVSPGLSGRSSALHTRPATPALFEARTLGDEDDEEDDDLPVELKNPNIVFTKGPEEVPLVARIRRVFYLNAYGNEIYPRANPLFIDSLATAKTLIYSCGSLYTSILPCLALRSVGPAIATSTTLRARVLLLNAVLDRETPNYTALDFVEAIRSACCASYGETEAESSSQASAFITHIVYIQGSSVEVDVAELELMGITPIECVSATGMFNEDVVRQALKQIHVQ